ncbi:FAD-dependent oxidoreductase [Rhodococcus sp. PSBB049]|uniref:NAD(P)/FAD-dependent oxidoreductase n=1 Tax=Rhodococcus sp. PSBB049 TaxID=2812863 RepID=UPI00198202BE|nr:FAD-dependent oxidoreductase [Rhodococcus sp. PSBB049]QSE72406.1 FAD-dependent oxidoreductase [Rhodococcus sp. PSBB049]
MTETYVVVGASLAGTRAVETLRTEGFDGRVVLVGAEHRLPYDRPPLSKELILGGRTPEDILLRESEYYYDNDIELLLGARVTGIDPHARRVRLDTKSVITADKVLICTGTAPRRPDIPGLDLDGVHFLRTVDDALAVRNGMQVGGSVVIVGGGLIGMELAASAVTLGNEVTVLERDDALLRRALGGRVGDRLAQWHRDRGVDIRTNAGVTRLEGDHRVRRVHTADGGVIEADLVVIGIGVVPVDDLARDCGIEVDNGILVDEFGETSLSGVFAAGDVANGPNEFAGGRVRLEHWQNAQSQGIAAARSMLGYREPYRDVPWFWSDQGELNIQAAGRIRADDAVVVRGNPEEMDFTQFHLRDGVVTAAIGVNRRRDVRAAMAMIDKQMRPDPALLSDPSVDLRTIGDATSPEPVVPR